MHGGSVKLNRGGGNGAKRNIPAPSINRNSVATSGSRLSSSGGHAAVPRRRDGVGDGASGQSTSIQADETFSLVTRIPLNFAMTLRLVPDLVEEISRVEAMNGTARIKFDSGANNANGNVISVGDKNFNFTWSREMGELCDIYEERKSGEDGSNLLIESGGAWRKLNVQRVLDESTKKHVKMRSEEAERKNKSRKSIVLDHQNSTVKSQMKALVAAESSWRTPFKRKELPFKNSKPGPSSAGGPPKPVYKTGLSSTNPSKGRPSPGSPVSSQTKQYGASAYPIVSSNVPGNANVVDATSSHTMSPMTKAASFDKEMANRLANNTVLDKPKQKSVWQSLEPDFSDQREQDGITMKTSSNKLEEETNTNSMAGHTSETKEKIDTPHISPDRSNSKNVSDNSDALAGTSSDGGSDSGSESNSSDSGTDSGSHSRDEQKSPLGSLSGCSSDSESDESPSSKQAPDEDVDIMTSADEKEHESMIGSLKSSVPLGPQDNKLVDLGNEEKQHYFVSDMVENDNPGEDHDIEGAAANYLFSSEEKEEHVREIKPSSMYNLDFNETQDYDSVGKDVFNNQYSDGCMKLTKGKSKRHSDDQNSVDRPCNSKRLKGKSLSQPFSGAIDNIFGESPQNSSPDGSPGSPFRGPNRDSSDGNYDPNFQRDFSQGIRTSVSESQPRVERSSGSGIQVEVPFGGKQPSNYGGLGYGVEDSERVFKASEGLGMQNGNCMETQNEREKRSKISESFPKKYKNTERMKDVGLHSKHVGYSPRESNNSIIDKSPLINGHDRVLQRELSKLELGEIREPLADEIAAAKKHRQPDNIPTNSESWNSDSNRGKSSKRICAESRKPAPHIVDAVVSEFTDGPSKQKIRENFAIDPLRPHLRETRPLPRQQQPSAVHAELASHRDKNGEMSNESRYLETEKGQATLEASVHKKIHAKETERKHGSKQTIVSLSMKDIKKQEPNMKCGSKDRKRDVRVNESWDIVQKKTDSSLDEMCGAYTKYEKQEPELKCPIKDIPQYKEYVKEYQEKYESYNSLNKILESYKDEFSKLGNDLETCRGRDNKRYQEILEEIKSSYRQCGEKHKRLKRIFNVLHEELKHLKQMIKDYAAARTKD